MGKQIKFIIGRFIGKWMPVSLSFLLQDHLINKFYSNFNNKEIEAEKIADLRSRMARVGGL